MAVKWKTFFLKSVPYVLSVIGGVVLSILAEHNVQNSNIAGLLNDISGSLLAIPFVFLLYDYSNYHISKRLNNILSESQEEKINTILINIILLLRQMLGIKSRLTYENLEKMGDLRESEISPRLKMTPASLNELRTYHVGLDNLIYYSAKNDIFSVDEIQILTGLSRDIGRLLSEKKFHRDKRISAKYIENILSQLTDWIEENAPASEHFQKILSATTEQQISKK